MKRVAAAVVLLDGTRDRRELRVGEPDQAGKPAATNLTIWVGWSARELREFKKVVAEYDAKHADVNVKVVGGINDDKIIAAIRAGNARTSSARSHRTNVGIYCPSGGWIDLSPYLKKDKIDVNMFPKTTMYYTQYKGTRVRLPLLADVYGFYWNKQMLKAAGSRGPPKTLARADDVRQEADEEESRRLAQGRRLRSPVRLLPEHDRRLSAAVWREVLRRGGKVEDRLGSGVGEVPKWQKTLVDCYGYKNLVKWQTGAGDEFSASHAFETGKLAMMVDGEWRVSFIAAEHPTLQYGTAPAPVASPSLYGAGAINGTIIGIPKNGDNRDEAWALVKYLTTNTHALADSRTGSGTSRRRSRRRRRRR